MNDVADARSRALSGWDENAPWLLSFFDLVLILLCFFIALVANRENDDRAMMPRPAGELAGASQLVGTRAFADARELVGAPESTGAPAPSGTPDRAVAPEPTDTLDPAAAPEPPVRDGVVVPTPSAVGTPPAALAEAVAKLEGTPVDAPPGSLEASFVGLEMPTVNSGADGPARDTSTGLAGGPASGAINGAEETGNLFDGGEYARQGAATELPPTAGSAVPARAVPARLDGDASAAPVWNDLENELREIFRSAGDAVEVETTGQGVTVRLREAITFPSAGAGLLPDALPLLDEIAALLVEHPDLRVEMTGHTDDIPIATATYPSNWELSAARAAAVARYLVKRAILDPARIRIAGHADHRPIAVGGTPAARARNRRVEVRFVHVGRAPV
jgi:flagellar motor protein MotB